MADPSRYRLMVSPVATRQPNETVKRLPLVPGAVTAKVVRARRSASRTCNRSWSRIAGVKQHQATSARKQSAGVRRNA